MVELPLVLTSRMIIGICNLGVPKNAPSTLRMDRDKLRRAFQRRGLAKKGKREWTADELEGSWPELVENMRRRLALHTATASAGALDAFEDEEAA